MGLRRVQQSLILHARKCIEVGGNRTFSIIFTKFRLYKHSKTLFYHLVNKSLNVFFLKTFSFYEDNSAKLVIFINDIVRVKSKLNYLWTLRFSFCTCLLYLFIFLNIKFYFCMCKFLKPYRYKNSKVGLFTLSRIWRPMNSMIKILEFGTFRIFEKDEKDCIGQTFNRFS